MIVNAYKTPKITVGASLIPLLDAHLPALPNGSIVVITSKIVSICQGRVIKNDGAVDKHKLIERESALYIDKKNQWNIVLTIKNDTLIASAGIDESNGNGYFILWPQDPFTVAREVWTYLRMKHHVEDLGVIITDSHTTPLRWGTSGIGIAWCGFEPLHDYIGTPDIFGRHLHVTKASVLDGLAASAVLVMGEGKEQTPLAVISDVPFVAFKKSAPASKEIKNFHITLGEDLFAPILQSPLWKKGESK